MQKVRVYWNLHKKCWSIQDGKSGLVIDHKHNLFLERAKFVVRKGGQKRVREEGKKNVHAFAYGEWDRKEYRTFKNMPLWRRVYYNPYKTDFFMVQKFSNLYEYKELERDMTYAVALETLETEKGVHPRTYI